MAKVTHKINFDYFKIYIDGILHLSIDKSKLIGIQSWVEAEDSYYIEIYSKGNKVSLFYETKELWIKVLENLDKSL